MVIGFTRELEQYGSTSIEDLIPIDIEVASMRESIQWYSMFSGTAMMEPGNYVKNPL